MTLAASSSRTRFVSLGGQRIPIVGKVEGDVVTLFHTPAARRLDGPEPTARPAPSRLQVIGEDRHWIVIGDRRLSVSVPIVRTRP